MQNQETVPPTISARLEVNGMTIGRELRTQAIHAWCAIAVRNGQSLETAVHQALVNQNKIEKAVAGGGQLMLKRGHEMSDISWVPEPS
jgi:hypothetical protein